ncbi:MAG: hypothetical protein AB7D46_02580 [Flavobacteriaceae bacterium]
MKNRLEAELISIAHRILKLKNKSEVIQLQQETLNLYEKLSVLRFVEDNYEDSSVGIPSDIEEKLEKFVSVEKKMVAQNEVIEEKSEEVIVEQTTTEIISEEEIPVSQPASEEEIQEKVQPKIEDFQVRFEDFEAQLSNAKPTKTNAILEEVALENEPVFVPVEEVTKEQTEVKQVETAKNVSINDAIKKNFNIGLNDRVAFEFHLFGGQTEDFNRVLSQLNTFETFAEAKNFIENMVKPDYNNWIAKEEYENRFLEIIESKF